MCYSMVIRYEKFYLITLMSLIIILVPTVNLHNRNWITESTSVPISKNILLDLISYSVVDITGLEGEVTNYIL